MTESTADLPPVPVPDLHAIDNFADLPESERDPHWYKRAVFYEVLVRSFNDSNGDGNGDLRGLIEKLDYLQWLGVDCLWLPPFFASPLRDGGYDVADYTDVLPEFGTIEDFVEFVDAAHARGMRVIIDFVMNHTSDQHPWFQASRNDPDGPFGDFYVWADNDEAYADARIIFVDTESSNWTFDPVRKQYFWHRFFCHQPDLNFENPRGAGSDHRGAAVLARPRHRRLPARRRALPLRGGGHQLREPPRAPTSSSSGSARRSTRTTPTACCSARPTSGRPTSSSTSATTATSARWPSTSR